MSNAPGAQQNPIFCMIAGSLNVSFDGGATWNVALEGSVTAGTGITVSGTTVSANLSTGESGGQSAVGGTAASDNLTLSSTTNATKGKIEFGSTAAYYNEATGQMVLGAGTATVPGVAVGSTDTGLSNILTDSRLSLIVAGVKALDVTGAGTIYVVGNPVTVDVTSGGGGGLGGSGSNVTLKAPSGALSFAAAALVTNFTTGYMTVPSCAGAPTGTPSGIPSGQIPIVIDSTDSKLYCYIGGVWKSTTLA